MFCKYCGTEGPAQSYCTNCGEKIENPNVVVNMQGTSEQINIVHNETDKSEILYNVLSFFIPLIGLIFFLIWKDEYPVRAKACLKWMIISIVLSIALTVLFMAGLIGLINFIDTHSYPY